jgi:hypothetical protein
MVIIVTVEDEGCPKSMHSAKFRSLSILDELRYLPTIYLSGK